MRKVVVLKIEELYLAAAADGDQVLLVDCGYPGFEDQIEAGLSLEGLSLGQLTWIVITHHDWDHTGSLCRLLERCPRARVLCSREQFPYVTGRKEPLRPETPKNGLWEMRRYAERVSTVEPGMILPFGSGIQILDTGGHQPGHISAYFLREKTLAAGDALALKGSRLRADPQYTMDMAKAVETARRLLSLDIRRVICCHGGAFEGDVREALLDMIRVQGGRRYQRTKGGTS